MFKLNELIIVRDSLNVQIDRITDLITNTKSQELKTLRLEELVRVTTLQRKVQSQLNSSARFDG